MKILYGIFFSGPVLWAVEIKIDVEARKSAFRVYAPLNLASLPVFRVQRVKALSDYTSIWSIISAPTYNGVLLTNFLQKCTL